MSIGQQILIALSIVVTGVGYATTQTEIEPSDPEIKPSLEGHFDAGGLKLYLVCFGTAVKGESTIIVNDGMGSYGSQQDWGKVIEPISKSHRICHYDRAGLGKSDPVIQPYTTKTVAEQLDHLLTSAKIAPPYLLVGHSFASYHVRMYNHLYSGKVAAILMVDPTVYGLQHDRATGWRPKTETYSKELEQMRLESIEQWNNPQNTPEKLDYKLSYQQISAANDFGDKPYRLIFANGHDHMKTKAPGEWPQPRWDRILLWFDAAVIQMKTMSTRSQVFYAQTSEHFIHDQEPQTVIKHIEGLLEDVKTSL